MRNMAAEVFKEKEESISYPVAAGSVAVPVQMTYFTFDVPNKSKMRLTAFSNYMNVPAAWGSVTWSVRRNGVGVYPFDTMEDQYTLSAEPRKIVPIEFFGGDKFEMIIINRFPAVVKIGVSFRYEIGRSSA